MGTKPPSKIKEAPADSLEKVAYASVSAIPTIEPNDQARLGYHVWRWLKEKQGTLDHVVVESGSRLTISNADAVKLIGESLAKQGIKL
jgi:hypothetical protein